MAVENFPVKTKNSDYSFVSCVPSLFYHLSLESDLSQPASWHRSFIPWYSIVISAEGSADGQTCVKIHENTGLC